MTGEIPLRILGIAGSLRRDSYNRRLLQTAQARAPANVEIKLDDLLGELPLFNEDLEQPATALPAVVRQFHQQVADADGLLIATPEYNQSLPGVLKNALDWLSRPLPDEVLIGKPVALIGVSGGRWGTRLAQSALRHTLNATESLVMPSPALYVREVETLFDSEGLLSDRDTLDALRTVLDALGAWIRTTNPAGHSQSRHQVVVS